MYPYQEWDIRQEQANYVRAMMTRQDAWVAGGCGTETPFPSNGQWYLYVYNPATGEHGYLNMATDTVSETY